MFQILVVLGWDASPSVWAWPDTESRRMWLYVGNRAAANGTECGTMTGLGIDEKFPRLSEGPRMIGRVHYRGLRFAVKGPPAASLTGLGRAMLLRSEVSRWLPLQRVGP